MSTLLPFNRENQSESKYWLAMAGRYILRQTFNNKTLFLQEEEIFPLIYDPSFVLP